MIILMIIGMIGMIIMIVVGEIVINYRNLNFNNMIEHIIYIFKIINKYIYSNFRIYFIY